MRYEIHIDRDMYRYIKNHGDGCISGFIHYALNDYLDHLEHADPGTLLDEIVKINRINLHGKTKDINYSFTERQLKRLTTLKSKYNLRLYKIVNRAIQFYIEKVYGARLELGVGGFKQRNRYTTSIGEENLEKINELRYNGELERAIKAYIEYFEGLSATEKLNEISKINNIVDRGSMKPFMLRDMGLQDIRVICERYGLKIKHVLVRAAEWYMERRPNTSISTRAVIGNTDERIKGNTD